MSKSGGSFGIGTIIFMVIMWNVVFDDDDEKEVDVVDQATDVAVETEKEVKPKLKEAISAAKEKLRGVKESEKFKEVMEKVNNFLDEEESDPKITIDEKDKQPSEEIAEKEKIERPPPTIISPESKDEQPKTDNFEKL